MQEGSTLTYPLLGLSVFARQLCLPIPAVLFLISAGTLIHDSKLNLGLVLLISSLAAVAGDAVWYEAGRHWGAHILKILTSLSDDPQALSIRSRAFFARFGLPALLIVKFVPGLDGITPPLAGMEGARRLAFVVFDVGGAFLWSAVYVTIGLCFARQVDQILGFLQTFERILLLVVGVPLILYASWRGMAILKLLRKLRTRHISPLFLQEKLKEDADRVLVIDLLACQENSESLLGIPGAVRIDPTRIRRKAAIVYPDGMSFVLYTSASNLFRCTRVALTLRRRGIENVWILEGGVRNWIDAGLPTTNQLLSEDEAIRSYGLRIKSEPVTEDSSPREAVMERLP